jgi:erythromycin esterase-like protein
MPPTDDVISALTAAGRPLAGAGDDYDYFLELIGDARLVLLGEATHGTHEFHCERAQITKRLIAEKASALWRLKRTGRMPTG